MPVVMIILGSLVTALLAIGIVGGVILSGIAVVRLIAGKGRFQTERGKRVLLSGVCLLNALGCWWAATLEFAPIRPMRKKYGASCRSRPLRTRSCRNF